MALLLKRLLELQSYHNVLTVCVEALQTVNYNGDYIYILKESERVINCLIQCNDKPLTL